MLRTAARRVIKPAGRSSLACRSFSATGKDGFEPDFTMRTNLADERFGSSIIFATDEWFATAENLLKSEPPVWKEGVFSK